MLLRSCVFQAEDGIRDLVRSRGLGDVYKRQVVVRGEHIDAVGPWSELHARYPDAAVVGDGEGLVTPGYVNAHQHLTGDRLIASCIPEAIDSQEAVFGWAVPVPSLIPN